MTSGIYLIRCNGNNKFYIGSSQNVYKRKNRHYSELRNNKHKNIKFQNIYNKYGEDSLSFEVLEFVEDEKLLIIKEQYYIDLLKPQININLIANSSLGVKRSPETIKKIRQANLGLKHPEWRNKIKSESQGGKNHWSYGKKMSDETKKKKSESMLQKFKVGYISPISKPVVEVDDDNNIINEWNSATSAGLFFGVVYKTILNIIDGKFSRKLPNKKLKFKKDI